MTTVYLIYSLIFISAILSLTQIKSNIITGIYTVCVELSTTIQIQFRSGRIKSKSQSAATTVNKKHSSHCPIPRIFVHFISEIQHESLFVYKTHQKPCVKNHALNSHQSKRKIFLYSLYFILFISHSWTHHATISLFEIQFTTE